MENNIKKIILFCQAPADTQYALSIYEKNISNAVISIICINVEGIYKFISSLNLNLKELIFIPYTKSLSINEPIHIFNERRRLNTLYKKYFIDIRGCELYFFSHWYDWVTFSILAKLHKNNKIYLIDHSGYTSDKYLEANISVKSIINLLIYKYITGIYLKSYLRNNKTVLSLQIEKYNVEKLSIPKNLRKIWNKYQFNIPINKKSILIFESGASDSALILDYERTITAIIQLFIQQNIKVYIKPHPRLGFTKCLKDFTELIPSYMPGEFLPIEKFIGVFGIFSAVIGKLASSNKNIYSIIDCFDFIDDSHRIYYKEYLMEQSNNKIVFIENQYSILELLQNK